MATRREMMFALATASVAIHESPRGDDGSVLALSAEYHRFDDRINELEAAADKLWLADVRAKRNESAGYADMRCQIDRLCEVKGRLANAIINCRSSSWTGVAHKLALWRREAAVVHRYDFDSAHEAFTFSAYVDVLRLADLQALAHRYDARTSLRMRDYW